MMSSASEQSRPSFRIGRLPNGSWVLVLTELVDRKGNQWFKVMVPFAEGRFSTEKSHFGFIPGSSIEAQMLVPSP